MKKEKQNKKTIYFHPDRKITGHNGGESFEISLYYYHGTRNRDQ